MTDSPHNYVAGWPVYSLTSGASPVKDTLDALDKGVRTDLLTKLSALSTQVADGRWTQPPTAPPVQWLGTTGVSWIDVRGRARQHLSAWVAKIDDTPVLLHVAPGGDHARVTDNINEAATRLADLQNRPEDLPSWDEFRAHVAEQRISFQRQSDEKGAPKPSPGRSAAQPERPSLSPELITQIETLASTRQMLDVQLDYLLADRRTRRSALVEQAQQDVNDAIEKVDRAKHSYNAVGSPRNEATEEIATQHGLKAIVTRVRHTRKRSPSAVDFDVADSQSQTRDEHALQAAQSLAAAEAELQHARRVLLDCRGTDVTRLNADEVFNDGDEVRQYVSDRNALNVALTKVGYEVLRAPGCPPALVEALGKPQTPRNKRGLADGVDGERCRLAADIMTAHALTGAPVVTVHGTEPTEATALERFDRQVADVLRFQKQTRGLRVGAGLDPDASIVRSAILTGEINVSPTLPL